MLHHLFPEGIYLIPETEDLKQPRRTPDEGGKVTGPSETPDSSSTEIKNPSSGESQDTQTAETQDTKTAETQDTPTGESQDTSSAESQDTVREIKNPAENREDTRVPEYAGENRRRVLVMYDSGEVLPAEQEQFLAKVLGAVHLGMQDIALVRYADCRADWTRIPADRLLLFGCEALADQAPELYQPSSRENQTILRGAPVGVIMADKQHKTQLWQALKQMFDV